MTRRAFALLLHKQHCHSETVHLQAADGGPKVSGSISRKKHKKQWLNGTALSLSGRDRSVWFQRCAWHGPASRRCFWKHRRRRRATFVPRPCTRRRSTCSTKSASRRTTSGSASPPTLGR